ncbi:protein ImuA [Hydrobacter penzbergensis]|uniref:Protein ImuA n=1 Tax=Hydrobacter penzbergensis TaxID=1235997 RepID=A0A8X8LDU6_9BACT|nr:Error-prone repair protein ImuA [Hydrobacter penzbergensis]SDX00159.1 protein ImuA [Hydrobacter penzbergensis]
MLTKKADKFSQLRNDILIRQGLKKAAGTVSMDMELGAINDSFPDGCFPLSAVHEFCCVSAEDKTVTTGFIARLLSSLMKRGGITLWLSPARMLFPPAFTTFGIEPDKIIFINLSREKDLCWMMEEALKCEGLAAVVSEIRNLDFTASRRLQLAVEQSKVTGLVIRQTTWLNTTASVSRWKITNLPSQTPEGLPGMGFPRWNVELLKIRNGRPGSWQLEWNQNGFREIPKEQLPAHELQREAS